MAGATNPGIVAAMLVMPNMVPANCGAMSPWLTRQPANAKPENPTARHMKTTASVCEVQSRNDTNTMNTAGRNEPGVEEQWRCTF